MIDELHVSHIALIDEATLTFSEGLTVLTGETGAGKTAMLSALGLIRGERADSAVVREGCDEAVVEARLSSGQDEHVLMRRLSAKGRSRCTVDGGMATVAELADAASSIRIHGQNESSRLLDPAVQLAYLDTWIDPKHGHLSAYRAARERYRAAFRAVEEFEQAKRNAALELEFMRYTLEQIERVNPVEGEYEQLEEELPRLQHAEQLARCVETARQALNNDGAVLDTLADALRGLEREAGIDPALDAIVAPMEEAQAILSDAGRELGSYAAGLSFEPYRLEETLARLDELQGLMNRFGPTMDDVFAAAERARAATDADAFSPARERAMREELSECRRIYEEQAQELAGLRHGKAAEFTALLAASVEELAMKGVGFEFGFEDLPMEEWTDVASERIELRYSPSPASTPRPLARIASGGELSRISLALECLHHQTAGGAADETLVFDEIDQGVGGATGSAVAERLAQLAQTVQVVVVTHLPQVAALADAHYLIEKHDVANALPDTQVRPVIGDERVAEIARMLAGTIDETALEHARSLLAGR